jgi:hypothetical protein
MGPILSVSTSLTLLAYSVDYDVSGVSPFLCCENDTNAYILKAHSHSSLLVLLHYYVLPSWNKDSN